MSSKIIRDLCMSKITSKEDWKSDSLVMDEIINDGVNRFVIDVYNRDKGFPLQKIWVKLPKVRISYRTNITSSRYINLTVIMGPMVGAVKDCYDLIKNIEQTIKKSNANKDGEFKASIKETKSFYPKLIINLPVKEKHFNFTVYDHQNKKIKKNQFDRGDCVSAYLELSHIWVRNEDYGCNWVVKQMKYYPMVDFDVCLFSDEKPLLLEDEEEVKIVKRPKREISRPHPSRPPLGIASKPIVRAQPKLAQPAPSRGRMPMVIPTAKQLKNMKKKLSKVVVNEHKLKKDDSDSDSDSDSDDEVIVKKSKSKPKKDVKKVSKEKTKKKSSSDKSKKSKSKDKSKNKSKDKTNKVKNDDSKKKNSKKKKSK